jgi:hypothetical protein
MKKHTLLLIALLTCFGGTSVVAENHFIPDVAPADRICFTLYTVQDDTLKLTAQCYPLQDGESRRAVLMTKTGDTWKQVSETTITEDAYGNKQGDLTWTAHFRVDNWNHSREQAFRVVALDGVATYEGLVRRDPVDKNEIVMAAFTGNSIHMRHGGDIARTDLVENVKKLNPDLLFFSGDQVYNHQLHLAHWLRFGHDFGDITRDRPTITIPDDHDVGQANLWGESGKVSTHGGGADGGYIMPASYVKAVERAQTWHLPDAYDPTPIQRGIGTYYTDLTLGRISFAILEDRKFKTGPMGLIPRQGPRPDHILNPDYEPKDIDAPEAVLLGERQLKFLNQWGQDWEGADMKAVLSQTIFCGGAHIHGKLNGRLHADLDSNGWPQTGRNKALAEMRRCFAVHIAGDQHLGTIFQHGIDDWEDAGFSFCVPSIANLYLRWWAPLTPGENRQNGMPDYTGRHRDGFNNFVTCWAAANPTPERNGGGALTTRAAGFGVTRFNRKTRQITFACWPRNVDIQGPKTKQYAGWPKTITQEENYGRKAVAYLPTLHIKGMNNPVIQIVDETSKEVVYTLRINGTTYRPKVFKMGDYTITVGEKPDRMKTLRGVAALAPDKSARLDISF